MWSKLLFVVLTIVGFKVCYSAEDAQKMFPVMGPSSAAFPLRNSYVPQAVSYASPAYVFASYSSGGYRLQGEGGKAEGEDDEDEKRKRKFMMSHRRFQ
ncbi:unnamed protein product [Bursaphelenchus okinawaensis]|uniref:Uncharacterized protein n=1 Tax=Bursaphelenchus okinawaensis TaxID=465554 RepID=A0A811KD23_9BILA|nr:unnamed protein product [Bursaphelenchus okinawaensis]CAG9102005.1 unnamed protein product [Bursaphelenchus okinawaensis]